MIAISGGGSFLAEGAIVLNEKELNVAIHALIEERDRVVRGGGNQYGPMTIGELDGYISQLKKHQEERGA